MGDPCVPYVVRLRRKGGVEVQGCDVYIGRRMTQGGWRLADSPWMNPYRLDADGRNREAVLRQYRQHVLSRPDLLARLPELTSKRLGCWCIEPRCHTCGALRGWSVERSCMEYPCGHLQCHGEVLVELWRERVAAPAAATAAATATAAAAAAALAAVPDEAVAALLAGS